MNQVVISTCISIFIYFAFWGLLCQYIASTKNRNQGAWFAFGAVFNLLAVIVLIAVAKKE